MTGDTVNILLVEDDSIDAKAFVREFHRVKARLD